MSRRFSVTPLTPHPKDYMTPVYYTGESQPTVWPASLPKLAGNVSIEVGEAQYVYVLSKTKLRFFDDVSGLFGGWDGAKGDPYNEFGPASVRFGDSVFWLYRTDHHSLGTISIHLER